LSNSFISEKEEEIDTIYTSELMKDMEYKDAQQKGSILDNILIG